MAQVSASAPLLFVEETGNGGAKGISSESRGVVQVEPVIAPASAKIGLPKEDAKPNYSLKIKDQVYVFGVDDVFAHGKRASIRRLNAMERYGDDDYFALSDMMFLKLFAGRRGNSDSIAPTGIISVPISVYNDENKVGEIKSRLVGKRTLVDADGCELRLEILPKRLVIIPESTGAIYHWAYDPKNFSQRKDANLGGTTLVIDIGYETTNCSLYEGIKYIKDAAHTIHRAGMGIVTRAIHDQVRTVLRDADVSRIDRSMRKIAGILPGEKKIIEPTPGVFADVTDVYDQNLQELMLRIAHDVETWYPEAVTRALLSGGGALHIKDLFGVISPFKMIAVPEPDLANVLGAWSMLNRQASR